MIITLCLGDHSEIFFYSHFASLGLGQGSNSLILTQKAFEKQK